MAKVKFTSKEQCEGVMAYLKAMGKPIDPDILKQYEAFKSEVANSDTPIYDTLVLHYPYGEMPQEKKDCIESTVAQLLEDGPHAEEPGLLLGKIQCGKTDTFEDIIGLAFDKGIDIAVVFTKGTKPLAQQTISRMKNDYRFFKASDDRAQRCTINIYDIMKVWNNLKQAKVDGCKTVIVCKKQATNLDHLMEMFTTKCPYLKKKRVLIVDDEADFASRNYRNVKLHALYDEDGNPLPQERETEMAKISQQIDDFRKIPAYCRYLQVTATPYCLYLQPQGELNLNGNVVMPFKPRFTSIVPIHPYYIGGKQYFEDSKNPDSMYSHLFHQVEQKCIDVLGHEDKRYLNNALSSSNIYGLTYAVVAYFMSTAVRRIQVRAKDNKDYKTSALIHVEIDKKNHGWQKKVIDRLVQAVKLAVVNDDQEDQRVWQAFDTIYQDFEESNKKGREEGLISVALPSKKEILAELSEIFRKNNYHVQVVNSDESVETLLNEETGELELDTAANVFIGGNILDRGITIKNMLCFFYGRNPKNFQQDTVLQHARMYGARSKEDMAVTRLHTTSLIYGILVRMNELDNQLRQWFIDGKDSNELNAIFVGYDDNIKPCATSKIKASNTLTLKPQKRILPVGFWTGSNTSIKKTIAKIDEMITSAPGFANKDADGIFEMDHETVGNILKLIDSTFVYKDEGAIHNLDHKNDVKMMQCALEYCASKSDGKVYVFQRTNRNMSRLRSNGGYIDSPHDGTTDLYPARMKAVDAPLVMFLRQNGEKQIDEVTGENVGWNNAPFYWPVLLTQETLPPVMYALEQGKKKKDTYLDVASFLGDIDPSEVLVLQMPGDLVSDFGEEGSEYTLEEAPMETRALKESTAAKYIEKDESGNWLLNPAVPFDTEHDHGLYSFNDDQFPFVLKAYKYVLLRNKRDATSDLMLLELFPQDSWEIIAEGELNEDGDLVDRDGDKVLVHATDILRNKKLDESDFEDQHVTQWIIGYRFKKVVKFQKCKSK